ncbi:hypothetical protein SAMN05216251_108252 [Actinacidiphila alni]|uniref:Uncharacterized protein n=1 Tax=Actinacidiphila alni TaxID=380248 RepID=A0A1I2G603_9ACTN|nr:hypothetical protein [Actinacidiphila alni]SFF12146.1 hypothetical protein SAMN05216251_108252 [Actinacidiphila alni]
MNAPLSPEQRATILAQLGDAKPATDGLLESFGKSIADRRGHSHPTWEDIFCLNLAAYMGEKAAPVLRRLLDAEAEVEGLRSERDQFADRVDTLTSVAKSNKRAYGEAVGTVAALEQKRVELEKVANAERERVAELLAEAQFVTEYRIATKTRGRLRVRPSAVGDRLWAVTTSPFHGREAWTPDGWQPTHGLLDEQIFRWTREQALDAALAEAGERP